MNASEGLQVGVTSLGFLFFGFRLRMFPVYPMPEFTLQVNGAQKIVTVEADTPLLWVLRDTLELTGTKFGCGAGLCGACSVHVNGTLTHSCLTPISQAAGKNVTTIEGLGASGLHPLQKAW